MAYEYIPILGESVKSGVAIELLKAFPTIIPYREQITEPAFPHFFIEQLTMSANEERKRKWWLNYLITIRYRVAADIALVRNLQADLDSMSLGLLAELQTINLGRFTIPFRSPRTEKSDGVLFYFANFQFQVSKEEAEEIKMQTLELDRQLKLSIERVN